MMKLCRRNGFSKQNPHHTGKQKSMYLSGKYRVQHTRKLQFQNVNRHTRITQQNTNQNLR